MTPSPSPPTTRLEGLERAFRHYLAATNLYPGLAIRQCYWTTAGLTLQAHHPAPAVAKPKTLLRELEAAFREILAEEGWAYVDLLPEDSRNSEVDTPLEIPVSIELWLQPGKRPYISHSFVSPLETSSPRLSPRILPPKSLSPPVPPPGTTATGTDTGTPAASMTAILPFNDAAIALPATSVEPPSSWSFLQAGLNAGWNGFKALLPYWSYGLAALIIGSSSAFAFAITRPCVVGSCERLARAENLQTNASTALSDPIQSSELETADAALGEAINVLDDIPAWSQYYDTAQTKLTTYKQQKFGLSRILQAQDKAAAAVAGSQEPPYSVDHWVGVQQLWQQAVLLLEQVPAESTVYDFAQQKLREYEANYRAIGHRVTAEEEAEANLNSALQSGQLAQARMETAASLAGWQLTVATWQTAIQGLSLVPLGTEAYAEAQETLKLYQDYLAQSQVRMRQETRGNRYYSEAQTAAQAAQAAAAANQWTLAVQHWRTALRNAQSVTADSNLYGDAQSLIATAQPALATAQQKLRTAVAVQTIAATLEDVCGDSATPCTISNTPNQMRLTLASQYALALEQAITPPAADGTPANNSAVTPEAQILIDDIMRLGNQSRQTVAVYDPQGGFIARYQPDLGGFTKH